MATRNDRSVPHSAGQQGCEVKRSRVFRYDDASGQVVEVAREQPRLRARWPFACEALAVHPEQIGEVREFDRTMGVPTEYRDDGSPIVQDPGHYRRYRRAHGVHFRNGIES